LHLFFIGPLFCAGFAPVRQRYACPIKPGSRQEVPCHPARIHPFRRDSRLCLAAHSVGKLQKQIASAVCWRWQRKNKQEDSIN
jgi:hypothetical protein